MFTQSDLHLLARSFTELFETQGHIESWAIDLSWDIIARFALPERMPPDFVRDFANVAREEGSHFSLLAARLLCYNYNFSIYLEKLVHCWWFYPEIFYQKIGCGKPRQTYLQPH